MYRNSILALRRHCGFQANPCVTAIVDCALLKVYTRHFENSPIFNIPVVLDEYMKLNEERIKAHCLQFLHSIIVKSCRKGLSGSTV